MSFVDLVVVVEEEGPVGEGDTVDIAIIGRSDVKLQKEKLWRYRLVLMGEERLVLNEFRLGTSLDSERVWKV